MIVAAGEVQATPANAAVPSAEHPPTLPGFSPTLSTTTGLLLVPELVVDAGDAAVAAVAVTAAKNGAASAANNVMGGTDRNSSLASGTAAITWTSRLDRWVRLLRNGFLCTILDLARSLLARALSWSRATIRRTVLTSADNAGTTSSSSFAAAGLGAHHHYYHHHHHPYLEASHHHKHALILPPGLKWLALVTLFPLVVHPDGYTWVALRRAREFASLALRATSTLWSSIVEDYGAMVSSIVALATFSFLFLIAFAMRRTLARKKPSNPCGGATCGRHGKQHAKKKRRNHKGNHHNNQNHAHHGGRRGQRSRATHPSDSAATLPTSDDHAAAFAACPSAVEGVASLPPAATVLPALLEDAPLCSEQLLESTGAQQCVPASGIDDVRSWSNHSFHSAASSKTSASSSQCRERMLTEDTDDLSYGSISGRSTPTMAADSSSQHSASVSVASPVPQQRLSRNTPQDSAVPTLMSVPFVKGKLPKATSGGRRKKPDAPVPRTSAPSPSVAKYVGPNPSSASSSLPSAMPSPARPNASPTTPSRWESLKPRSGKGQNHHQPPKSPPTPAQPRHAHRSRPSAATARAASPEQQQPAATAATSRSSAQRAVASGPTIPGSHSRPSTVHTPRSPRPAKTPTRNAYSHSVMRSSSSPMNPAAFVQSGATVLTVPPPAPFDSSQVFPTLCSNPSSSAHQQQHQRATTPTVFYSPHREAALNFGTPGQYGDCGVAAVGPASSSSTPLFRTPLSFSSDPEQLQASFFTSSAGWNPKPSYAAPQSSGSWASVPNPDTLFAAIPTGTPPLMGELTLGVAAVAAGGSAAEFASVSLRAPPGLSRPSTSSSPPSLQQTPFSSILLPGLTTKAASDPGTTTEVFPAVLTTPPGPPAGSTTAATMYARRGRRRGNKGTRVRENPFEEGTETSESVREDDEDYRSVLVGVGQDNNDDDGMMDDHDPLIEAELRRLVGNVLD